MEQPDNKPAREPIVERLIELRKRHRYAQQHCADALGISQSSYAEIETGETRIRRRDLVTLSVLFGMTLEDAFPGVDVAA